MKPSVRVVRNPNDPRRSGVARENASGLGLLAVACATLALAVASQAQTITDVSIETEGGVFESAQGGCLPQTFPTTSTEGTLIANLDGSHEVIHDLIEVGVPTFLPDSSPGPVVDVFAVVTTSEGEDLELAVPTGTPPALVFDSTGDLTAPSSFFEIAMLAGSRVVTGSSSIGAASDFTAQPVRSHFGVPAGSWLRQSSITTDNESNLCEYSNPTPRTTFLLLAMRQVPSVGLVGLGVLTAALLAAARRTLR